MCTNCGTRAVLYFEINSPSIDFEGHLYIYIYIYSSVCNPGFHATRFHQTSLSD